MLNKYYYKILTVLAFLFILSGCSKQLSYDELITDLPASTNNRVFKRSTMNYEVSLPMELKFLDKQYDDTLWFELFVDSTISIENGSNLISVMRYLSDEKTPKDVYQKLFEDKLISNHYDIHSKGETNFLNYPSYYIHCSNIISNQNRETILFIFRGKSSDYYMINLETGSNENYPNNMKQLLSSVKSFNILP